MKRKPIKLIRLPEPQSPLANLTGTKSEDNAEARRRISLLLEQFNQINTRGEIQAAVERGLPFNHGAFAKWCGVGTDTLRRKNSDLFAQLTERLAYLESVAGRPLRGRATKRSGANGAKETRQTRRVSSELAALQKKLEAERARRQKVEDEILRLADLLGKALQTVRTEL